jgi:hypothetical protein
MFNFKIKPDVLFTIDLKGVAILNRLSGNHLFILYPEAAVWSVFIQNHDPSKSIEMLKAILTKSETETETFINNCLQNWRSSDIID